MRKWLAAIVVVVLAVASGCSLAGEDAASAPEPARARDEAAAAESAAGADGDALSGTGAGSSARYAASEETLAPGAPLLDLPEVPGAAKVIKNVTLDVEVGEGGFQRQFARAGTIAEELQGFVSASRVSRSEDGELVSGTITVRVPADKFEQAVARIKELGEVTGEDRSGQDVTRQFVDLEARLKHAQTEEAFYLRLMGEAKSVGDMIQVQSQLSAVQLRIEEIQGQLQYLRDQTSYSTLTAHIFEPGAAGAEQPQPLARAWQEAVDGFQTVISGTVVGIGWLAPFVLMAGIGLVVVRYGRRWRSRPLGKDPEPSV